MAFHLLREDEGRPKKPMIVCHGLLGSCVNWRSLCKQDKIQRSRDCYLVGMRNHSESDHHENHSYELMSEDIIRFADQHDIPSFTLLGHSMGARAAMTTYCRFPDRVDGCISVDAAPKNEMGNEVFGSFTYGVL